jgi:type VI secretion system secreted protein Hcp
MAVDMFMKIDDIRGEASDAKHKDEIDVLSWSWGVAQSGSAHHGSGTGTGKATVHDVSFTKYLDRSTPVLMKYCCTGKFFQKATLLVRKAGDKPVEYIKLEMNQGLITSVSTGSSGHDERLSETVTVNFKSFKLEYTPQKDGKADAVVPMSWDISKNAES